MKPLVIACSILKDELDVIIARRGLEGAFDIVWMPEQLHNVPADLRQAVQEEVDAAAGGCSEILLAYGNCGNAFVGLCAREAPIIIPRFADCISMLLCGHDDLDDLRKHAIFQTRGWLDGEQGLEPSYERLVARKGEKRAQWVIGEMYKNYDTLLLIDDGSYDAAAQLERVARIGELYRLAPAVCPGSTEVLELLLCGEVEEGPFVRIEPHGQARLSDFFPELARSRP